MLREAVPYTGPEGNLRYKEWYFTRDTGRVVIDVYHSPKKREVPVPVPRQVEPEPLGLAPEVMEELSSPYKCRYCKDTHKQVVFDVCGWCMGSGCKKCNGTGETKTHIPCQSCQSKKART